MIKEVKHLKSKSSRDFFNKISNEFELEDHNEKILILACECLDVIEEGRLKIEKEGAFYTNRFGEPRTHPAIKVIDNNKIIFLRLIKQLGLDLESERGVGRPTDY